MDNYKETSQTWNKFADLYADKFMDLPIYNETYDYFSTLLENKAPTILEIGCGPGNIPNYILTSVRLI
jgi:tRNA G46 methylase TrmB